MAPKNIEKTVKLVGVPADRLVSAVVQARNYMRDFADTKPLGSYHAVAYWLDGVGIYYAYQTKTSVIVRWLPE